MTREQQIEFMENCQQRIQQHIAGWMRNSFFRGAFHYRRDEEPQTPKPENSQANASARRTAAR